MTFTLNPRHLNNPPKQTMTPKDKVYLCLSIDDFVPDPMVLDEKTGIYSLDRMVPAIEMEYFFTINGAEKYLMTKKKRPPLDNIVDIVFVNIMTNKVKSKTKLTEKYLSTLDCFPRPIRPGWPEDDEKKEPEWDFNKSVFYGYKGDNDDLLAK